MSIWGFPLKDSTTGWECRFKSDVPLFVRLFWPKSRELRWKWKKILVRLDELSQTRPGLKSAKAQWSIREADLSGYMPYEPVMDIDLRLASPEVVNAELQRRIDQQAGRIGELRKLVAPWGISLDGEIASIDELSLWFSAYLHLFTKKEFLAHVRDNKDPHCDPYQHRAPVVWYSIALDISLYMMSMLQSTCPSVRWGVSKQKPDWTPLYNRPVLYYATTNNADADFESHLWALMPLLSHDYWTRKTSLYLRHEYKKSLTACQRLIKKEKAKSNAQIGPISFDRS